MKLKSGTLKLTAAFYILIITLLPWGSLIKNIRINLAAVQIQATITNSQQPNPIPKLPDLGYDCQTVWLQSLIVQEQINGNQREQLWKQAIICNPAYMIFIHNMAPNNLDVAEFAVQAHPDFAKSWFWLAEATGGFENYNFHALNEENRSEIAALLRKGLELNPSDGLRWRELGDVLRPVDPQAAIAAYLSSCFHGDPGSNGCYRAGQIAERLGEVEEAIQYYRYSRWEGDLTRADELEQNLNSTQER